MPHFLLPILVLTPVLFLQTESAQSSSIHYGHRCRFSHGGIKVRAAVKVLGANINIAFLDHYDQNNTEKYSQLMGNITTSSSQYYHINFYVFSFIYRASSVENPTLSARLALYNRFSVQQDNVFNDTRIDEGFLTVEKVFLKYRVSYVPNLCILLTTSPADNKSLATAAAKSLFDSGVNIMVIAIGDDVDKDDVKDLASNENYVFTAGKNMSNSVDDIRRQAESVTRKIKTALMEAHALPKYTKCYEAGHFFLITDVDKDVLVTVTQLREFVIEFDTIFASVKILMINYPTDDERFMNKVKDLNIMYDPSGNLTSSIKRVRQTLLNARKPGEKIIILATNRKVYDLEDVIAESRTCRKSGVHIMALGVGAEVSESQLSQIITDPRGLTKIDSHKDFKSGLRNLYRKICSSGCHSGWTYYNGMCYIYKAANVRWLTAQKVCGNLRARLVSVTTPEKQAWLKEEFLDKHKKPVHIGLRKYSLKSVPIGSEFRWENGKHLLFSDWNRRGIPAEPNGVTFQECVSWHADFGWRDLDCKLIVGARFICEREALNVTEDALKGTAVSVLPLWEEKVCPAPADRFHRLSGPIIVTGNDCTEDCTEYQFQCSNGRCVSLAYFCDYWDDCGDNSDEAACVRPRCESWQWQCNSGQCIPKNSYCDLHYDCYDKSDEGDFCSGQCRSSTESCDDGTCIPGHWIKDGHIDCGGGGFEDERDKWNVAPPCYLGRYKDLFVLFINPEYNNERPNCTMVFDGFGKHFKSFTSPTEDCRDNSVICPIGFYRCPSSFCIPIEKVCDGGMDCLNGEEEVACDQYECPGYYRCPGASYCLHPSRICDGEVNCPGGKDELMCDAKCPHGCSCSAGVVECRSIVINMTSPFDRSAKKLILTESQVLKPRIAFKSMYYLRHLVLNGVGLQMHDHTFDHQINLINLNISHNNLSEIIPRVLSKQEKLTILDLSYNPLKNVSTGSFEGLKNLQVLYMRYTSIGILDQKLFSPLKRLEVLDVRGSSVHSIVDQAFFGLGQLRQLYMQDNIVTNFGQHVFAGLDRLEALHTDMYSLCCPQVRPRSLAEADCISPKSSISSCRDLLANDILRSSVWLLCIASVVGNAVSLVIRLVWDRPSMQSGFGVFVTHLGIADFLMGIYLLIIAVADTLYKGTYIWNDYTWRHSYYCKIAGALSTLSSEASTFFICLITLDRFFVIKFPFGWFKFRSTSASVVAVLAWIVATVIATAPLIPSLSHWNFYIKNGACLAFPFTTERHPGWIYSVAIFTGLNFVAFIVIAVGQYSIYRAMKKGSIVSSAVRRAQEMAIARKLAYIVITDFLCWFPIGILSILALSGVPFGGDVYAWTAVFILPVNSALNPFLYTIPAVMQKARNRRQTSARTKATEVSAAQIRVRIGDPDSDQKLLEDILPHLVAQEDKVKLIKDICEGLVECSMTGSSEESQPNAVYLSIRGKVVVSICLATRPDASPTGLSRHLITSLVNIQPGDK